MHTGRAKGRAMFMCTFGTFAWHFIDIERETKYMYVTTRTRDSWSSLTTNHKLLGYDLSGMILSIGFFLIH